MRSDTCWIVVLAEIIDGLSAENVWIVALTPLFGVSLVYLLCPFVLKPVLAESKWFLLEFLYKKAVSSAWDLAGCLPENSQLCWGWEVLLVELFKPSHFL